MSAFAVIYDLSSAPVEPGALERVMKYLDHRGPDGSDAAYASHAALGHWHFWTTPEEVGERQPLQLTGLPLRIVLDGRLDNRDELLSQLGLAGPRADSVSDAALVLYAYERWGESCFERFVGEYALVLLDERRGALVCARDPLGDRTLFYTTRGTRWMIASEPWALAADSKVEINECALSHYFALQTPADGQTLFRNIFELLPAQAMTVTETGVRKWTTWQPDPSNRLRGLSDMEYAARFRDLLEQAVRCRMRATTPVGVLMSGGLDSSSVASLAARMLAPVPLTTISYVFNELTDCDERQYIQTMINRWGIRSLQIPCDDAWPLRDWEAWPRNPNQPEPNPYRLLKERAYSLAHAEGLRVLMPGAFGDELYDGEEDWLADLIAENRWREVGTELWRHVKYGGLRNTLGSPFLRHAARRILRPRAARNRRPPVPIWLTPFSAAQLGTIPAMKGSAFPGKENILGLEASWDSSSEIFHASRHALELRHPYRDRRLVEYMLSLPAHQLYNRGYFKYILRNAMQDILPDAILSRQGPTPLASLLERGMEREGRRVEADVQDDHALWRTYVRAERLARYWNVAVTPESDGAEALLPWLCISSVAWFRSLAIEEGMA
jgi:asparagine synthase (glutamine-hydrolysing)